MRQTDQTMAILPIDHLLLRGDRDRAALAIFGN